MKETMLTLYVNQHMLKEEDGQDLVEYALIACMIALACCAGLNSLASVVNDMFFTNAASVISHAY